MTPKEIEHLKERIRTYVNLLKSDIDLMSSGIDAIDNIEEKDLDYLCDCLFDLTLSSKNIMERELKERHITLGNQFTCYQNMKDM